MTETQTQAQFGTMYHQLDRLIDVLRDIKGAIDALAAQQQAAAD